MDNPFDTPQFERLADSLLRFGALGELLALLACFLLAWLIVKGVRRKCKGEHLVLLGPGGVQGVLFPLIVLGLAYAVRSSHDAFAQSAVFTVAVPLLFALVIIRLAVRVLNTSYPGSGFMRAFARLVSWAAWLGMVLWVTGILPRVLEAMDAVRWKVGNVNVSLRNLLEGGFTAGLVLLVALWVSSAIEKQLLRGTGDDLSMRKMAANIVRAALLVIGVVVALSVVGIDVTALGVLGGALGVGLGFGLQKIASNYVSGFVILAERSLRIGDMVKVDNFEGRISDIRTRYTVIRSLGGREAIVPNETLITTRVENASLADPRVLIQTTVPVAYGTDVIALQMPLTNAMLNVPRVIDDPGPGVQLSSFDADGMTLTLNFWIRDPENGSGNVKSDIHLAVLEVFKARGVDIPFPQRVVRMVTESPGGTAAA